MQGVLVRTDMDVSIVRSSVFDLPSKRRVDAIAYDGAVDMRLWRGPGPDRDLDEVYGGDLQSFLDQERGKLGVEELSIGQVVRVHPGHLHCDFLVWIGSRQPEPGTSRTDAPSAELLRESVIETLRFVAERSVDRVAFPPLGEGPNEVERAERLAIIVRAAHEYETQCQKEGRPPVVEEVLICEPIAEVARQAQSRVARLAKTEAATGPKAKEEKAKKAPAKKRATRKKAPAKPVLDPAEVEAVRHRAQSFSIRNTYALGDWMQHSKFGIGKVVAVTDTNAVEVLFEDGSSRKLAHGR